MTNHHNRRRWAIDQQKQARRAYVAAQPERDAKDAARLLELRKLAVALDGHSHMASTLAAVRAEIDRLSAPG
jgi:hypothetical protein